MTGTRRTGNPTHYPHTPTHGTFNGMGIILAIITAWCATSVAAAFLLGAVLGRTNRAAEAQVVDVEFHRITQELAADHH